MSRFLASGTASAASTIGIASAVAAEATAAGRTSYDARWVMAQMGRTDARLTLQVYAQVIQRRRIDFDLVWQLMRFPDESRAVVRTGLARAV